ncbi:MAG: sensor histidine kinase [Phormidesmis sp. RL_2_1]|nr:sensor histidine kinase [Phormidesmis sp. RL_2_1]
MPFLVPNCSVAAINAALDVSYCVVLIALSIATGFSLKVIFLSVAVLLLHFLHRKLPSFGVKSKYFDYALLLIEFLLLSLLSYSFEGESKSILFLIYPIKVVLDYPAVVSFLWVYIGYSIYLFVLDPQGLSLEDYILRLISFSVSLVSLLCIRLLIRQRQSILDLHQRLQSQAELTAEMIKLKERNELAEAMHDTLGHTLTASIVSLEGVALLWEKRPGEAIALLNSVRDQLQTGLGDIRSMVRNLKTNTLAEHALLKNSLMQMVERVNRQPSVNIELLYSIQATLLPIQDYVLYSVVQESLTNALKHSQADSIQIALEQIDKTCITLTITDNGVGSRLFEPGFGLTHLSQKVEALGGTFAIETRAQSGFSIQAWMPLASDLSLSSIDRSLQPIKKGIKKENRHD